MGQEQGKSGADCSEGARSWQEWKHMYINDILSMPDKWEYPWFAT